MIISRKNKIAIIVAIIVLFAIAVSTMGVSYAVWTSPDGTIGGGQSTASPSVTPDNSYVWAKYFNYKIISDAEKADKDWQGDIVEISTFYTDGANSAGLNLSDVFIPNSITIEGKSYQVYRITNGIFADATLKNLPVVIHVPSSVREIDDAAFAGLPNLETVYFANENPCTLGEFAFAGCSNLKNIYNIKGGTVTAKDTSFLGTQITITLNTDGTIKFSTN